MDNQSLATSSDHVVDWQLACRVAAARYAPDQGDLRGRIRVLEAQAMKLLRAALTNPTAAATQRSLAALEAEIGILRADLAWRRVEQSAV